MFDGPPHDGREREGAGSRSRPLGYAGMWTPRRQLLAGDVVALAVAWTSAALIPGRASWDRRLLCAVAAAVIMMVVMQRAGLYRSRMCALRSTEVARTACASIAGGAVFAAGEWLAGAATPGSPILGAAIGTFLVLVLRWRFVRWLKDSRSRGRYLRTIVLLGTNEDGATLCELLTMEPELGYRVGAVVGENPTVGPWAGLPARAETRELAALAWEVGATGIIVVGSAFDPSSRAEAINQALAAGLHVQVWPGVQGVSNRRLRVTPTSGIPLLYVEPKRVASWQRGAKRAMDVVLAAALCPVVAPVVIVAALWIRLEDGRPVLYRHHVVGRFGAPITVLKLRTMVRDAATLLPDLAGMNERTGGPLFKASNDPRVTRIGRILRATSIDELPQLWNVLNGTMSLVGPRFALPAEAQQFDEELRRRHEMRPGITGLWQSEARDNPSFSAYRRLDLLYVDNWSLALDVAILFNTVHAVILRAIRIVASLAHRTRERPDASREPVDHLVSSEVPRAELLPNK